MWRVRTGSRLHLGLLSLPTTGCPHWPDRTGQPTLAARYFGGIGLMIDTPEVRLHLEPANAWSATGPLANRAMTYARRVLEQAQQRRAEPLAPRRIVVEQAPPEHVGLGVGTQLGLAVASTLVRSWQLEASPAQLASWIGRGMRSAIGVHGFSHGGVLIEGGKRPGQALSPLLTRVDFPAHWRVVLAIPSARPGLHGEDERAAFARLAPDLTRTDALCRLVLLGILPALLEADLPAFSEAVHDFNARVGEWFATQQAGIYASSAVADLVAWLRGEGIAGVAQSSWGPGVCAFVESADQAEHLSGRLVSRLGSTARVWIASGRNRGAEWIINQRDE
jgi:beta-ribofuranosylaminobenzene 5'-phosphate synthase